MRKRSEILLLLLSFFSTFTFSKHFLVEVDHKGADENSVDAEVEDEKGSFSYEEVQVEDEKEAEENIGHKLNRQGGGGELTNPGPTACPDCTLPTNPP